MQKTASDTRLAQNTVLLYFRTFFTLIISLYISRLVLSKLGVVDYGIYNVVGGFVAMFSMISGSLTAAISRFLTFELGKNNFERLKTVFSVSVTIQFILALFIFILAEVFGLWFLNSKMNIPPDRLYAANWVLQCSIITFFINLLSVPYNASIISHERMKAFAYIGILEALLKLISVVFLFFIRYDKLIIYAILLMLVSVIVRIVYTVYCKKNFEECHFKFIFDKPLIVDMISFAGWNMIGSSSAVLKDQGVNIVINLFHGPVVNAARGIALQISNAINQFIQSFMTALNPQITKSYAVNDQKGMFRLIFLGSRFSFYLLMFMIIPLFLEIQFILNIWLVETPEHTKLFAQLMLILIICESVSYTLITAMLSTGKIRNYQIVVGGLNLLNLPLAYLLLKFGYEPEYTILISIFITIVSLFVRLIMLKNLILLPLHLFLKNVVINELLVLSCALLLPTIMHSLLPFGFMRFMLVFSVSMISSAISILYVGCSRKERILILNKIQKKYHYGKFK